MVARVMDAALREAGHEVWADVVSPELELDASAELVVVVGGDGTVHHAARRLIGAPAAIYHVPTGTENLFARQFGMTRDASVLLRAIERCEVRCVDVATTRGLGVGDSAGRSGHGGAEDSVRAGPDGAFLLMLSIGPDAGVVQRLAAARTGSIGHWSYAWPIVKEVVRPSLPRLTVDVDGKRVVDGRSGLLIVANSREYGARLDPAFLASITDGVLDVVFLPAGSSASVVAWAARARAKVHRRSSRLVYETGREVRVTCESAAMPYQIDGEFGGVVGGAGMMVSVVPGALRVLCPEKRT